jgi:RNA-directed DNA polymerase
MSEDAPGNPGAVAWPDDFTASVMVRRMQAKLHRWAGEDLSRCFGDLFNLVYDPAFLVGAFGRVAANAGAKTAGIDGVTVAHQGPRGRRAGIPGPGAGLAEVR